MSAHKNQHYVPKHYFRWFSKDPKRINLIRKATGQVVIGAGVRGQSARENYHGDRDLEDRVTLIENRYRSTLTLVRRARSLAGLRSNDQHALRAAVLFQRARTLIQRDKFMKSVEGMIAEAYKYGPVSPQLEAKFRRSLSDNRRFAQKFQVRQLALADVDAVGISDLRLVLLVNRTDLPFIFSDAPVVFYNQYAREIHIRGVLGHFSPGLQIFYPIDSSLLLMFYDAVRYVLEPEEQGVITLDGEDDIAALNSLQLHNARGVAYFGDERHAPYVRRLWQREREAMIVPGPKTQSAPGFNSATGESIGDVIHTFEPQLPFELELSFVTCSRMDKAEHLSKTVRSDDLVAYLRSLGRA